MLEISVSEKDWFDERTGLFITAKPTKLILEHSLISLSKWESKWKVPYFDEAKKHTLEQSTDYIRCMTINKGVDPLVYFSLSPDNMQSINDYIKDPMSATTVNHRNPKKRGGPKEFVTSELIYYWMVSYGIPFECEKWHLNRLLKLIDVCNAKGAPPEKMSRKDILKQNAALNAARLANKHK